MKRNKSTFTEFEKKMCSFKHILVAVMGRTPQVVTETLYALMVLRKVLIAEIWLLTTREGKEAALEKLLASEQGQFFAFCHDWGIDHHLIKFDKHTIRVAHDLVEELPDIRQVEDNERFVELMVNFLRDKTSKENTVLHCSLAGGRKTMSVYLAFALQFFGRAQDKLYHVLLSPQEFESNPDFFYPPPEPRILTLPDGREICTSEARIDLAEVPYVRLRAKIEYLFGRESMGFNEMVRLAQAELEQMPNILPVILDTERCQLLIGATRVALQPLEFCIYRYYAERSLARPDHIPWRDYHKYFEAPDGVYFPKHALKRLLELYGEMVSAGVLERFCASLEKERGHLPFERVCQHLSRIKGKIRDALEDETLVEHYIISAVGRYRKQYGIKLDKSKIVIQ